MYLRLLPVLPALRERLLCAWLLEGPPRAHGAAPQRIFGGGQSELIVNLGDPILCQTNGRWWRRPDAWYEGIFPRYFLLRPTGRVRMVGLRFRAGLADSFTGAPQNDFAGLFVPLGEMYGSAGRALEAQVRDAPTPEESLDHMQAFLAGRSPSREAPDRAVQRALACLDQSHGARGIDALSRDLGVSRRTLERRFLSRVGLTPKRYARTVRLDHAMRLMRPRPAHGLTEIAYAAGYCDQAHMNEEFRELGGVTPTGYLAESNEIHHAFASTAPRSPGDAIPDALPPLLDRL